MAEFPGVVLNPSSGEVVLNMKRMIEDDTELARRRHSNAATFDKAIDDIMVARKEDAHLLKYLATVGTLIAGQTGETENQQNTSPADQGMAETAKGTVATSNAAVAASIGNLATAAVSLITATGGVVTAQSLAAVLPALVTAIGGASTPSQTQPKPTTTS